MRSLAVIFLLLCAFAGDTQTIENEFPQQFEVRFASKEDKHDLVRLRDFLESRDQEYSKVRSELEQIQYVNVVDTSLYVRDKKQLEAFLEKQGNSTGIFDASKVDDNIRDICDRNRALDTVKGTVNVSRAIETLDYWLGQMRRKVLLEKSRDNLNKDRDAAEKAIQSIYTVEKGDQEYKTTISLYYAIIIFALILISFFFLFRKSSSDIGNDFLNGNGLQFIALFAIIISTILFGILGILEGKELAAILSGIAGFILGKGLNVNLTKTDKQSG